MAVDIDDSELQFHAYQELASTYTAKKDIKNALLYEKKAITILRITGGNDEQLAVNLLNSGYSYYTLGEIDSALILYKEAGNLFDKINLDLGKAYTIGNSALVYWKKGKTDFAIKQLYLAIEMLVPLGDQYGMADYHNQLAAIYSEQNNVEKTIEHTQLALSMAEDMGLKEQIRDAVFMLSKLYAQKKNCEKAFEYQSLYMAYNDSIVNNDQSKKMADMRTDFELSLKEKEIDLLEKRQKLNRTSNAVAVILLLFSVVLVLYFRQGFRTTKLISITEKKKHEKEISDMLNKEQTKALQSMIQGRDNERKRLAKEIHNHFGSLLATVKVNLIGIEENTSPRYQTVLTLVDQACTDIRNMSHSLNMGLSENFGLIPSLKELIAHLRQSGGLDVEFTASMCSYQIDSDNEIAIYRIIQELISNVLKHAGATKLSIIITCFEQEKLINILVNDNGKGFIPNSNKLNNGGMGLKCLEEMVESLQGEIQIDSHSISGTTVNIDLPLICDLIIT
jgi:signal transduction histidine kinase